MQVASASTEFPNRILAPEFEISMDELCEAFRLGSDGLILDVRSTSEFVRDAIPGSIHLPALDDEERADVGTLYKKSGSEIAYKRALAIAADRESKFVAEANRILTQCRPRDITVTCWRGGGRSAFSIQLLKKHFGNQFRFRRLTGGTKAYRKRVLADLSCESFYPSFRVLSGMTGVGKSLALERLEFLGAPVLHIERCARHMSSIFGAIPYMRRGGECTQRQFENNLHFDLLRHSTSNSFVWTEAESKRVGALLLPKILDQKIHASEHVCVQASIDFRCDVLVRDYVGSNQVEVDRIGIQLDKIRRRMSPDLYNELTEKLHSKDYHGFGRTILLNYYDKVYRPFPLEPRATIHHSDIERLCEGLQKIT